MYLCYDNPQLLNHEWAVDLVQRLGGKVSNYGDTALMLLFDNNAYKTRFNSQGFKLLWEREKNIKIDILKDKISKKSELKERVIAAVPGAVKFYKYVSAKFTSVNYFN